MLNRRMFSVERIAYSKKRNIFLSSLSAIPALPAGRRYPLSAKKGFTLIELLIAITLVGMILLTISAVDLASRRFLNTSDFESRVQNEVSPAMEHMVKQISRGVGNSVIDNPIIGYDDNRGLKIWVGDDDPNINPGRRDHLISYRHDDGTNNCNQGNPISNQNFLRYCAETVNALADNCNCSSEWEVITDKLLPSDLDLQQDDSNNPWGLFLQDDGNLLTIILRARQNPNSPAGPDNPQVELTTTVAMRGVTTN